MEKRKPHYSLTTIRAEFSVVSKLRMTFTAVQHAEALGFDRAGVVEVIRSITGKCFYKSMTSEHNNKVWQDVYHVPAGSLLLYVKFTMSADGHLLISFKEK
jgi:motility quorum-sensing regulator/GCU-specific mRNA interferase toxin